MGYACPVCETPQRDGEHLANHLAFTAMLHGDEHEDWLDEHVDDWGDRTPVDLASSVTEFAEETEYDEVFEDTTGATGGSPREGGATATREHDDGHGHDHVHGDEVAGRPDAAGRAAGDIEGMAGAVTDEAVESVLSEARELTEEMYEGDATAGGETGDDDATASGETGDDDTGAAETTGEESGREE